MSAKFFNLSNHPVATWSPQQLQAAREQDLGEPYDLPNGMPLVPPEYETEQVEELADQILKEVNLQEIKSAHVSGEPTLTLALVKRLQAVGITCVCATTSRVVAEEKQPDGSVKKTATFRFVRWRRLP